MARARLVVLVMAGALGATALGLLPGTAIAANPITSFSAGVLVDENVANPQPADYSTQAGGHPDVGFTKFTLNRSLGSAEFVRVDLPPGMSVNPQAIPRCNALGTTLDSSCPSDTRVGRTTVKIYVPLFGSQTISASVYNMAPTTGVSDFAFEVTTLALVTVRTDLIGGVRYYPQAGQPGDFGEYFTISNIANTLGAALESSELIFWGAPEEHNGGGATNNAFLTNPTICNGAATTYMYAQTYNPVESGTASYTTPVGASGCGSIPFAPTLSVTPSTTRRDEPNGVAVDLHLPQSQDPATIATSQLREAQLSLPEGMTLNPAAAGGLEACTDAQFGADTNEAIKCPSASEVGTVEITTPPLAVPLTGRLYVGTPLSNSPESGEEYRLFIDAENATEEVKVRLVARVSASAKTGRLTATVANAPQVPFSDLTLNFKTGPHATFANPLSCGVATETSSLVPYSGNAAATPSASFTVDNNGKGEECSSPLPFTPTVSTSLSSKATGAYTNLILKLERADGEQTLSGLTVKLPEGMLANLSSVTLCEGEAAANGTCSAGSKIGEVTTTAGVGTEPLSLPGTVYLTNAYGGGSLGLSIVVPAEKVGPYDLGTVVVRAAVNVDTVHGQITISTDPLPQIIDGVPLRLRTITATINHGEFLVNPDICSAQSIGGSVTSASAQSEPFSTPVQMEGCSSLSFSPTLSLTPSTTKTDSPLGLLVDTALASNSLGSAVVNLPEGITINPAAANGLTGCSDAQFGRGTSSPVSCPAGSKVGTVTVSTPLLPTGQTLTGSLYVGTPLSSNPESGQEYRLFLDAENATYGISVRLIGAIEANGATGRLVTTFAEAPPMPFTELKLDLNGGPHAPLASPQSCGVATTTATLISSAGLVANPTVAPFTISLDGKGAPCSSPLPFSLSQGAASEPSTGGSGTSFTLSLARGDGNQYLGKLTTTLPAGLVGRISTVSPCPEPQAARGACSEDSRIGTATVAVGAGEAPFSISGPVYLTSAYGGGPYGLSVVVNAEKVGPFDFGTIVTRAAIAIDPHTSQVTISSDALPSIIGGVPLRLKALTVVVGREGFMVNPTSCDAQTIDTTLTSTTGATQSLQSPFQVTECRSLAFSPKFTASTSSKSSRADGVSLDVKLTYPAGAQANVRSVFVTLPKQLPSRLSTLNQACTEATFDANPSACPAGSRVGTATVITPVLPEELTGPAIFVSHGAASFPDLDLVLSGDGVNVVLVGNTDIKNGVTTSNFASVPDVPITSFDLQMPSGPHSALAAPQGLCGQSLIMPTTITAQNGKTLGQQTRISVAGCPGSEVLGAGGPRDLSKLKIGPSRFRAATKGRSIAAVTGRGRRRGGRRGGRRERVVEKTGTTISYRDRHSSTTTFVVERRLPGEKHARRCIPRSHHPRRHSHRCTRYVRVGSFVHHDVAGLNRFHFTGRLAWHRRIRKLAPGTYRLIATTTSSAGVRSASVSARFSIKRG